MSKCVVVENLGVDLLIGEPGKIDNFIVTKSHLGKIETRDIHGQSIELPYFKRREEHRFLCRAIKSETLLPGDLITFKVPPHLHNDTQVAIAPTRETEFNFITPKIITVNSDKTIHIRNESNHPVRLKKNVAFADITAMREVTCNKICTDTEDQSHLQRPVIFQNLNLINPILKK